MSEALAVDKTPLTRQERAQVTREITDDILGYGPLEPFLRDDTVTEVMVNGPHKIYIERRGKLTLTNAQFVDDSHLLRIIDKIISRIGRRVDEASPMVDARLPDGSRVNAIIPPLAIKGPTLTIRKFRKDPFQMQDLIKFGTLTPKAGQFLEACVRGKLNILISGGTGSGKTTTLNVLSAAIPDGERIITVEDAAELQLSQEHVITLETRPANIEGKGQVTIRDLVRNTLRMRPDRIIVGECRGPETVDMLQAMNTGHDGSLTTIHANTPRDAMSRVETLVLTAGVDLPLRAIREQSSAAFDLIVQVSRLVDGSRRITHITEVLRMESDVVTMQDIFVGEAGRGHRGDRARRQPAARPAAVDRHQAAVPAQAVVERRQAPEPVLPAGAGARRPVHGLPPPGDLMRRLLVPAARGARDRGPDGAAAVIGPRPRHDAAAARAPDRRRRLDDAGQGARVHRHGERQPGRQGRRRRARPTRPSIVLAIDISGSMKGGRSPRPWPRRAQFLASVKPNDQVAIVTFGHTAQVIQPLTSDTAALATALSTTTSDHTVRHGPERRRLDRREGARDGAGDGPPRADRDDGRRGLLVARAAARGDARQAVSNEVAIYSIALRSRQYAPQVLQQLAGATGGSFRDAEKGGLANVYYGRRRRAREDLRAHLQDERVRPRRPDGDRRRRRRQDRLRGRQGARHPHLDRHRAAGHHALRVVVVRGRRRSSSGWCCSASR